MLRYVEKDEKGYETFVANRVSAIREQPLPSQWRYVQTELNPADYACEKYLLTTSLSLHMHWITGPDFPLKDETMCFRRHLAMLSNQGEDADRNVVKVSFVSFSSTTAIQINVTFERFSNCTS